MVAHKAITAADTRCAVADNLSRHDVTVLLVSDSLAQAAGLLQFLQLPDTPRSASSRLHDRPAVATHRTEYGLELLHVDVGVNVLHHQWCGRDLAYFDL